MKTIYLLLIATFTFLFFGCSNQKEQSIADLENGVKASENVAATNGGQVPGNHPIFMALKSSKKNDLKSADILYKKEVVECKNKDFCKNLKHLGFKLVMENNLAHDGSKEQKQFYLNEQISMKRNFPNIENFYSLLVSCKDFMTKDELMDVANQFLNKNKSAIENAKFSNPSERQSKMTVLLNQQKLFERYLKAN